MILPTTNANAAKKHAQNAHTKTNATGATVMLLNINVIGKVLSTVTIKGKHLKRRLINKRGDCMIDTEFDSAGNELVKFIRLSK